MNFSPEQIASLSADLISGNVKSREQAGRKLSYIEAWWAIAEANRIFGFDGWQRETVELRQLGEPRMVGDKCRIGYSARVRITVFAGDRIIIREGCGFGSGIDKDVDQAHESALKEAESDAMKRALMTFGNPFGLALYDKTQAHVSDGALPGPTDPRTQGDVGTGFINSTGRKSSAQAKRDGDDEKIKTEISGLDKAGLADFHAHFDEHTATMPRGWLEPIQDMLENRLIEINGQATVAAQEADMDAGFSGAVGREVPKAVAGRNGALAA